MVSIASATRIRKQISEAIAAGARAEIPMGMFPMDNGENTFVAPQILTNVTHEMSTLPSPSQPLTQTYSETNIPPSK